jgi:O-antigen/teichoic acid export membrane protein
MVLSTAAMFTAVGSSGLGITAAKHVAEYRSTDKRRVGEVVGVSLAISAGFGIAFACIQALLAPVLANHTLRTPALAIQLEAAALIVMFSSLNTAQIGVLQGFEAFRVLVRLNFARAAVTLALVAVGALSKGLSGAVYGYAVASFIVAALQQWAIRRTCRENEVSIRYSCPRQELISLFKFSLAVLVSAVALVPANWWAMAQLATRTGYGQVGLFTAMYQWQSAITFIAIAIGASSLPVLTSVLANGNIEEYRRQIRRVFMMTSVSAAMVALPIALMSGSIVRLYGKDFRAGTATLVIVCLFSFLNAAAAPVGTLLWSTGSTKAGVVLAVIGGVSLLIFAALFTRMGATGLALAYLGLSSVQVLSAWLWWTFFKSCHHLV